MRFAPPTLRRAPRPSPGPPQPRQPPPVDEADLGEAPQPVRRPLRVTGWLSRRGPLRVTGWVSRRRPLRVAGWLSRPRPNRVAGWLSRRRPGNRLMMAGAAVVLLCFGIGLGTDSELLTMGSGAEQVSAPERAAANRAAADRVAAEREAADRATARKVAAANAADEKAAAERAAKAKAAVAEAAREQVVAMPFLVGLKLDVAMDMATDAGLTAVTVCRTPGGDTPLWWSNWRITGQDVPPGTRIGAGTQVCVSATK